MTRIAKLYAATLANPRASLPFRDFERLLTAFGFTWDRTTGSHRQYIHPEVPTVLTILPGGKDAKPYQVKLFLDIIRRYELDMDG